MNDYKIVVSNSSSRLQHFTANWIIQGRW